MPTDFDFLFIAAALSIGIALTVAILARNITFFGRRTDNHHHVEVAARLNLFDWPSKMHAGSGGNAAMKVFPVYLLAVLQRLMGDRKGEFSLTVLCILSNVASAILIYVVAAGYWGHAIAFALTVLFVTSLWPWMLALHGGPVCLSQTCLLASVFFFQHAPQYSFALTVALCFAGGFSLGLSQLSSGSARKYIPLSLAAFLFGAWTVRDAAASFDGLAVGIVSSAILLLLGGILFLRLSYKPTLNALYDGKGPRFLADVFPTIPQRAQPLAYFHRYVAEILQKVERMAAFAIVYTLGVSYVFRTTAFLVSHLAMLAGLVAAFLWLTYPSVARNMDLFFRFANADKWAPHFPAYESIFAELGHPMPTGMRGAGPRWVVLYLWRICPFLFAASIVVLAIVGLLAPASLPTALAVAIVGLSPILVAEVTRAPQMGRSYFPAMVGLLLSIGYGMSVLDRESQGMDTPVFWVLTVVFLLAGFTWNAVMFLSDVLPARLAPSNLGQFLIGHNITTIATYDNPYNNAFIHAMKPDVLKRVTLQPITALRDVHSGWVVVPGTSARSFHMESESFAIRNGDFRADPDLNYLLDSGTIEQCAEATFKTFGTSRLWGHESEVVSYFDLILRRIGKQDRYRGRAWILDARKVQEVLSRR